MDDYAEITEIIEVCGICHQAARTPGVVPARVWYVPKVGYMCEACFRQQLVTYHSAVWDVLNPTGMYFLDYV